MRLGDGANGRKVIVAIADRNESVDAAAAGAREHILEVFRKSLAVQVDVRIKHPGRV